MYPRFLARLAAVTLGFAGISTWASATAAVTIQASAQGTVGGNSQQDLQGPASSGEVLAQVGFSGGTGVDLTGQAVAQGAQNDAGVAAVRVDGAYTQAGDNRLSAETRWSTTATNDRATPLEFLYSFFVVAPKLTIYDQLPLSASATSAEWHIVVLKNGVPIFEAGAKIVGGGSSHALTTDGTSLQPRFFVNPTGERFGYDFAQYSNMVSLGFFQPGQSVTVETILTASTRTLAANQGASAEIGDPLKLGSDPGISGVIIVSEPVSVEPQSWSAVKALYGR